MICPKCNAPMTKEFYWWIDPQNPPINWACYDCEEREQEGKE